MALKCRAVAPAAAFLWIVMATTRPALTAPGGASFRVESASLDLGTVVAGETVEATFVFHNDGSEDVHIIRARPS
jgi:hypothetical protein